MIEILIGALVLIGVTALYAKGRKARRPKEDPTPNLYPFH